MDCDFGIPTTLLRFLGACVYGNAGDYYADLNEAGRAELEAQGKSFGMEAWFYRYLYDTLPEGKRAEYQKIYQSLQLKNMISAQELKRLYKKLAASNLRFVPIKGADLAFRLYPDAALRVFGDWDIWFHPDDCERALETLAEDGWKVPKIFTADHEAVRMGEGHHFSPHVRGKMMLEPHFTLSRFLDVDPYELWTYTLDYPAGDGQRILSPELNLLMLARHASSFSYYHAQIPKLLTDSAMVMKENVDYGKLHDMVASWPFPYPGDLLAAFPDFFPPDKIMALGADPVKSQEFRNLFLLRGKLGSVRGVSMILSRYEAKGQIAGGILKRIRLHNPEMIRRMYHLPEQGARVRLLFAYVHWFWTGVRDASQWLLRKHGMRNYGRVVENLENNSGVR